MKEADIRKYAALMKELELTALEISEDNKRVRLERSLPGALHEPMVIQAAPAAPVGAEMPVMEGGDGCVSVRSSFVGVFYAAPAENAEPFVAIGDRVEKGQTLCIIEAMKLMNDVVAEEDGELVEICAENGSLVEFGQVLFKIF